jgi:hypothetical protein
VEASARCRGRQNDSVSPMLQFLDFDLSALLQQVISRDFPNLETSVSASFFKAALSQTETLANVGAGARTAKIRIHEILNRGDTPCEIIEFVLVHEVPHIVIPPREIDGRTVHHPPNFGKPNFDYSQRAAWPGIGSIGCSSRG